jgi:hypothetical protein
MGYFTVENRILNHTVKDSGCWEWTGDRDGKGYGRIRIDGKKYQLHRISYKTFIGEIPKNICVLHHCDNKICANPKHLFLGTKADNAHDRDKKGRTILHIENLKRKETKITKQQVDEIKKDKRLQREIAIGFGLSQSHISRIKRNLIGGI